VAPPLRASRGGAPETRDPSVDRHLSGLPHANPPKQR
jgi:hypothetical protein